MLNLLSDLNYPFINSRYRDLVKELKKSFGKEYTTPKIKKRRRILTKLSNTIKEIEKDRLTYLCIKEKKREYGFE